MQCARETPRGKFVHVSPVMQILQPAVKTLDVSVHCFVVVSQLQLKVSADAGDGWGGVSQLKFKGLSRSLRTDWCVVLTARRRSGGQDSAEREQVSPGLLFALKLNSVGWGFHRHQECIADALAEQGGENNRLFRDGKKFLHRRLQVTPTVKVRTNAKVSTYCKQPSAKVSTYNRL